jgi:hypothetical protein
VIFIGLGGDRLLSPDVLRPAGPQFGAHLKVWKCSKAELRRSEGAHVWQGTEPFEQVELDARNCAVHRLAR